MQGPKKVNMRERERERERESVFLRNMISVFLLEMKKAHVTINVLF